MVNVLDAMITAVFTGLGVAIGNTLYDIYLREPFTKYKEKRQQRLSQERKKKAWLAALLNFFFWGTGYLYLGQRLVLGFALLCISLFVIITNGTGLSAITGQVQWINTGIMFFLVSMYLAVDAYHMAKGVTRESYKAAVHRVIARVRK